MKILLVGIFMLVCLIVFFSDRKRIPGGASGAPLYRSDTLERLWPYGFSSIGDVTFESAA